MREARKIWTLGITSLCVTYHSVFFFLFFKVFSLEVKSSPILISCVPEGVDLIPNNQSISYIDLIGIDRLLMCFFTNKIT